MRPMCIQRYRFIDNGNAPEFFANGLHAVEVMGSVSRFVMYLLHTDPEQGTTIAEAPFTCIVPNEAIGPAIALTVKTLGSRIVVPALGTIALDMLKH